MSITEIFPAVQNLSRQEKFQLIQLVLEDLAQAEQNLFREGQTFAIHTPEYAPGAANQLAQALAQQENSSDER